jgi:dihydroorotase/N-acyl-D-amino-acid deacylase
MRAPSNSWENFYLGAGGGEGILVSSVLNRDLAKYEGKRINEVARMMSKQDEIDALFDLLIADNAQTSMIIFLMSEDDVKLALRQPWVSVGVDHGAVALNGPLAEGKAHPRGYGSFPRILRRYVWDEHVITLEDAIRKMTSLAANRVHLVDRGLLRPGSFADVVVFNPEQIRDVATFEDPNRLSTGMMYVIVNGVPVVFNGKQTNALPGRPLRGPGFKPTQRT